jgi:NAD(P)-dependent dehydrogenase (short-subunit alcohol dehydrogenase family)
MPNILVIGATGYIGQAVASALVRSGNHTVYGLARSDEKAKLLTSLEVIPVEGSIKEPAKYLELIHSAPIDIVVDVAAAFEDSKIVLEDLKKAGKECLDRATAAGARSPKLGFIYGSGIWVHGDAGGAPVSDLCPVGASFSRGKTPTIVAWRLGLRYECHELPPLIHGSVHIII